MIVPAIYLPKVWATVHAGVFADRMVTTGDGYELTWQVNVLAPYVLGALLVNAVKERIVNVSSISAGSRINFDNLNQVISCFAQQSSLRLLSKPFSQAYSALDKSVRESQVALGVI